MNPVSSIDRALERVQNLYAVQTRLIKLLESDLTDPVIRRETHASLKEFQTLLQRADHRYMGGEDVWQSLKALPTDALALLRKSPSSTRHLKAVAAKAKKAMPAPKAKAVSKSRVSKVKGKKKSRR